MFGTDVDFGIQTALAARFDPELSISRWLAQGLVEIVTEANLAFTIDEAREVDAGLGSDRESDANSEACPRSWRAPDRRRL